MSTPSPYVSVIVPVRNEERYVRRCLTRLLEQDYPPDRLEIVVVDCLSEDQTRAIVLDLLREREAVPPALRIIDDPGRERTTALNAGVRTAAGEVIMRIDARSMVPPDYVRRCVETLEATGADNVGGMQQPIAEAPMQEAIGLAMTHPFGVGDAQFRIGKRSGFVDTVYLGSFRREVFSRIGLFDDVVPVLSEDSDINQRIRDRGGRVYLNTEIRAGYYPRDTLRGLVALYGRYGAARAGNVWKHKKITSWRQAVPPFFVLALATLGALAWVRDAFGIGFAIVLGAYLLSDVSAATWLAATRGKWYLWPRLIAVFPCMHVAWALGFFYGLILGFDREILQRPRPASSGDAGSRAGKQNRMLQRPSFQEPGTATMSADEPLVSIIVPAHNAERYLARAIRSALGQTYANFELIVVDDGSTDGTPDVIASFKDNRVRRLSQPNCGQGAARNSGIRASRGRYVTFLDADDAYLPEKVQRQVEYLVAHPQCHIVFCRALHCYEQQRSRLLEGRPWRPAAEIFRDLLRGSRINPNALMIAGDVLRDGFFFREERYYPEEWDLYLRLAAAGYEFGYQDVPLVVVEIREDSNTAMEIQWILKRHTLEMFERLFSKMSEGERRSWHAASVLRSCRVKLAVAALASQNPRDALRASSRALPRAVVGLLDGALRAIPPNLPRAVVGAAWKFRQRRALTEVRDGVIGRAWNRILGPSVSRLPRVLQLITLSDFGGAQQCVRSLVTGLRDRYEIAVACAPGGPSGALVDRLRGEGVRVIAIDSLTRTPHPLRDIEALWTLTRLMRRERFAVVHCHSTKAGFLGRIAARLAGIPAVLFTAHGWQFVGAWPSALRFAMIAAEWVAGWFSTVIICVSEYDRQIAMAHRIGKPDRLVVVHNGVDPAPWPGGDRSPDGAGGPRTVVAVGRLTAQKDPITLVEAWALVPGDHRLLLVGDGPLRADVEAVIRRAALADRVQVLPPTTDIPALMRTVHVFLMSSRWEGLPLAVIEAMMSGLPVVATRVGGVPEVVADGETGLLVPPGDPAALAAALRRVLDQPSLAYRMGQAGRRRALAYFTEARMLAEIDAVYNRVLMAAPCVAAARPP